MSYQPINLRNKFTLFAEQWQPRVIAEMNDYQFKIVKLQGDFIWHDHEETDETFLVVEGDLRIDFRDGAVHLSAGEMFVVPKGVEHKPYAEQEVKLLLIEPRGVPNTGEQGGDRTAANDVWICGIYATGPDWPARTVATTGCPARPPNPWRLARISCRQRPA